MWRSLFPFEECVGAVRTSAPLSINSPPVTLMPSIRSPDLYLQRQPFAIFHKKDRATRFHHFHSVAWEMRILEASPPSPKALTWKRKSWLLKVLMNRSRWRKLYPNQTSEASFGKRRQGKLTAHTGARRCQEDLEWRVVRLFLHHWIRRPRSMFTFWNSMVSETVLKSALSRLLPPIRYNQYSYWSFISIRTPRFPHHETRFNPISLRIFKKSASFFRMSKRSPSK